ncbi:MAG: DUF1566 domain-containing protein, partial [Campylobacterota bacterium]|nr:DUF1566 domain-containing protein [Campylobacterota bacterium]
PVVNAGADQTIIEGESASLQCVANDVDGSVTSTEWLKDGVLVSSQDRYTTPSTLAVGSYVYSCKATDDDGATGADSVVVTVSAAPTYPDLIVQSPSVNDTTLTEGQSFTASAIVKNQGAGSSASTTLRYYISTNSIISTSDTQLGTDAVSVLSSNGTSSENETVSTSLTSGSYWVGACVDSVSGESSTSNNCSTGVAITIGVQTITIAEAIDNNTLLFSTSGSNDWYGQSSIYYHDNDATQSGNISDNESSSMQTTVTGPGIMSFFWKVSSEANYDKLNFSLDGNQQAEISGNIDWIEKSVTIPSGEHTLTWEYEKDSSVSSGTDAGWVDNLVFKPEVQQAINPAIINYLLSSEIFKTSSSLKKTGQTIIYYQGDDGYYEKGVTSHYTRDDAKEVVTDHLTNLEWADDASVASVRKQWVTQANYDAGNYFDTSGDTATTYCATLALDGGGWRLPTIEELVGLSDYGRHTPAIDPVFVNVDGSLSTYWSSTSNASYSSTAWLVSFYSGTQSYGSKDYNGYVRCVRAGQ